LSHGELLICDFNINEKDFAAQQKQKKTFLHSRPHRWSRVKFFCHALLLRLSSLSFTILKRIALEKCQRGFSTVDIKALSLLIAELSLLTSHPKALNTTT
jgi:hypothetical protein